MSQHESYLLHIWHSRALSGWQWVARVDRLSDGKRFRFADPEALLEHVRALAQGQLPDQKSQEKGGP